MIDSPCVNVCQMSAQLKLCAGCLRTLDEIARWSIMQDGERARVLAALAERRARLGPFPAAPPPGASAEAVARPDADHDPDRR